MHIHFRSFPFHDCHGGQATLATAVLPPPSHLCLMLMLGSGGPEQKLVSLGAQQLLTVNSQAGAQTCASSNFLLTNLLSSCVFPCL